MGESALIHFVFNQTYTLDASMTDKNGKTYEASLNIEVRDQYMDDEYLYICAKKGETVSITPQFRLFSKEYPYGTLTTCAVSVDAVAAVIAHAVGDDHALLACRGHDEPAGAHAEGERRALGGVRHQFIVGGRQKRI